MTPKFRAWDTVSKQMFGVYSIEFRDDGIRCCLDWQSKVTGLRENWLESDRLVLMQFTGLKDKSGKEICSGDILGCYRLIGDFEGSFEPLGAVYFDEDLSAFCVEINGGWHYLHSLNDDRVYRGYEVIGTIYENPELLN